MIKFTSVHAYRWKIHKLQSLRSHSILQIFVSRVRTELEKTAFKYIPTFSWNDLHKDLKLSELVTMEELRSVLKDQENSSLDQCDCVWSWSVIAHDSDVCVHLPVLNVSRICCNYCFSLYQVSLKKEIFKLNDTFYLDK